ncbi:DNA mismatch repair protein MutS [Aureibaculum sp. 2210JD6-5]|uniref:MutS-related protein n=1 Tax=Aureibaculum sp. 2210JD6-5 TaxID=3103957 RepID=UPI002AAD045D|nr:DNA mismatch repair protein MutS [Aureibaculum sp. 2210JD6-5]MDY7395078.1 DNA mismatch repair protein MutS [Aureibaculum sp. 2210JD6-5]
MNWLLGLLFILIIIYLINNYNKKKRLSRLKKGFIENWGKPKSEKFYFQSIGQYFYNNQHKNEIYHLISDRVKSDLDIDAVFQFIDRTTSKIGQQFLYYKLRTIGSIEKLKKFSAFSKVFINDPSLRLKCQVLLSNLNATESYELEKLINDKTIEKPKNIKWVYALTITAVLSIIFAFVHPLFLLILIPVFAINTISHYKNKENITYYLDGVTQLNKSLIVSKELIKFKKIKSYFTDVEFIKKINAIHIKTKFIGFEKQIEGEFTALFWLLIELVKILFNIEYIVFYNFIDAITKEKKSIEQLFLFIGEIDAAISVASLKAGKEQICTPNFTDEKQIQITEIYHPLIKNCVDNDLNLTDKSMLLTGSNMSGKTTFIRTIAVNSILAQTLHICFAKSYTTPFFKVHTSIRIADDLQESTSYYLQEVLTIKDLIEASNTEENCLFVLDEIFKGTNTIERISGGKAILSYLNQKNHIVLVSTHDIELTELLEKENYDLYHFSEQIKNDKLLFDHKLKNGKLKTRNAIKILELYDYPAEIIADAKKTEFDGFK